MRPGSCSMRGEIRKSAGVILARATEWLIVVSVERIGGKRVIETYRTANFKGARCLSL
jgi:hypothetical protein